MNTLKPPVQIFGKIPRFFLDNIALSTLIFLFTIFLGVFSYITLSKQYNPKITLPAFEIEIHTHDFNNQDTYRFITQEVESSLLSIPGVDTIQSQTFDNGRILIVVEFFVGENLETSKTKIFSRLEEILPRLSTVSKQPHIRNVNPDHVPIVTLGFSSSTLSQNQIRKQLLSFKKHLESIEGISTIDVLGGEPQALKIILDPEKMLLKKVSTHDIIHAIQTSNIRSAIGAIETNETVHTIEVQGRIQSPSDIESIVILPGIHLRDIATIQEGYSKKTSYTQVCQSTCHDTVFLSFAKLPESNAIHVAKNGIQKLEEILKNFPELTATIHRNEGEKASQEITSLGWSLVQSILIVSFTLFFFLGWKSALIVSIAIPLTLSLVFFTALIFEQSINRITLFALILSLGLLVDSATVAIENIYRHLSQSRTSENETKNHISYAIDEIGAGLLISTLTSIVVFLPLNYISGMMGEYMGPLAFFVPIALVFSLGVAYTLTPFLAWNIFSPHHTTHTTEDLNNTSGFFSRISEYYGSLLTWIFQKTQRQKMIIVSACILLIISISFPFIGLVHFRMLPKGNMDHLYLFIETPQGTAVQTTHEFSQHISKTLLTHDEVTKTQIFSGVSPVIDFNGLYKGAHHRNAPHLSTLKIELTKKDERKKQSPDITLELRSTVTKNCEIHAEYKALCTQSFFQFIEEPPGPPVQATFVARIEGSSQDKRDALSSYVQKTLHTIPEVMDIVRSSEPQNLKTVFSIDHEKARMSGVSTQDIVSALQLHTHHIPVSPYHAQNLEEIAFIELSIEERYKQSFEDLQYAYAKNSQGNMVPISSITKQQINESSQPVLYRNHVPVDFVTAELGQRSIVYAVIDAFFLFKTLPFDIFQETPLTSFDFFGITYTLSSGEQYRISWGGEWEMTIENFRDLIFAMIIAFILVYAILVAQFRSFFSPALIMVTVPFGFIGIMLGFSFLDMQHIYLTATALIGFIALMGIVVNNAIIYLEYVTQKQQEGYSLEAALIESGKTRLRPIMLTSLTTVLGSITIASDPVWSGLAWSIIFGLSFSTFMTLGIFPVLYIYSLSLFKTQETPIKPSIHTK